MRTYEQDLEELIAYAISKREMSEFGSNSYKFWDGEVKRLNEAMIEYFELKPAVGIKMNCDFSMKGMLCVYNDVREMFMSPACFIIAATSIPSEKNETPYQFAFRFFGLEKGFIACKELALININKKIDEMV